MTTNEKLKNKLLNETPNPLMFFPYKGLFANSTTSGDVCLVESYHIDGFRIGDKLVLTDSPSRKGIYTSFYEDNAILTVERFATLSLRVTSEGNYFDPDWKTKDAINLEGWIYLIREEMDIDTLCRLYDLIPASKVKEMMDRQKETK